MLQVARLAPRQLGESRDLVAAFLRERLNPDGGFQNRAGTSDLYYGKLFLQRYERVEAEHRVVQVARAGATLKAAVGVEALRQERREEGARRTGTLTREAGR